jgi:hypothetical protein
MMTCVCVTFLLTKAQNIQNANEVRKESKIKTVENYFLLVSHYHKSSSNEYNRKTKWALKHQGNSSTPPRCGGFAGPTQICISWKFLAISSDTVRLLSSNYSTGCNYTVSPTLPAKICYCPLHTHRYIFSVMKSMFNTLVWSVTMCV